MTYHATIHTRKGTTMYSLRKSLFSLAGAAALMLLAVAAQANTINVSAGQSIQAAIDAAQPNDTILIGPGTYYENLQWNGKDLVIKGAGADSTVIDVNPDHGGPGGTCLETNGLSPASRLEGVTLTGGRNLTAWNDWYADYGVTAWGNGMRNNNSSPTVVNCAFLSNNVLNPFAGDTGELGYGGGMCNFNSNPAVSSCTFQGNVADYGGSVYNENAQPTFTACSFQGGLAEIGHGIFSVTSAPTFTGCTFQGDGIRNRGYSYWAQGGGATISGCTFHHSDPVLNEYCNAPGVTITNCIFDGCANSVNNYHSTLAMTNSSVINSLINTFGPGQVYNDTGDLTLTGCLIANNTNLWTDSNREADIRGVAIWSVGTLHMTNCTVANNLGGGIGAGLFSELNATITNCIFWNNRGMFQDNSLDDQNVYFVPNNSTVSVTNCDIDRSSVYPGVGNTNSNPLLVNPTNGDFHLQSGSPCINTGNSAAVPTDLTTDLDGLARISGSSVDMGCYEKYIDTTPPVISAPTSVSATATSVNGALVTFSATAMDNVDGPVAVSCSPASGSLFPLGTTNVHCTARDAAGNTSAADFPVSVTYSWSGFLQPINADGSSVFKAGSTVPVKFALTGASAPITNALARLSYAQMSGGVSGPVNEAVSNAAGDSGNFRYDATSKTYLFNWSTKGIAPGTYQLSIDLGDGVSRTVNVGLK
jgi:hypothetical protein